MNLQLPHPTVTLQLKLPLTPVSRVIPLKLIITDPFSGSTAYYGSDAPIRLEDSSDSDDGPAPSYFDMQEENPYKFSDKPVLSIFFLYQTNFQPLLPEELCLSKQVLLKLLQNTVCGKSVSTNNTSMLIQSKSVGDV